jgi:hypothetical protein
MTRPIQESLLEAVLDALAGNVRTQGAEYMCRAIWRGGDGFNVHITPRDKALGGFIWYDHARQVGGHGQELAALLELGNTGFVTTRSASLGHRARPAAHPTREQLELQARLRQSGQRFLDQCDSVSRSQAVVSWAATRQLSLECLQFAGVLASLHPKSDGYRLVLPVYDATGTIVSYRTRWVLTDRPAPQGAKERNRKDDNADLNGRVYACPLAQRLLRGDVAAVQLVQNRGVVIAEGGPDWLTVVQCYLHRDDAPACFGVWSQSVGWDALWRRLPERVRVCIATDHDTAGHQYATKISRRLNNNCQWWRSIAPPSGQGDLNDVLRSAGVEAVRNLILGGQSCQ